MTSFELDATAAAEEEEEGRGWWVGEEALELPATDGNHPKSQDRQPRRATQQKQQRSAAQRSRTGTEPSGRLRNFCPAPTSTSSLLKFQALAQRLFFALPPPLSDFVQWWQFDRSLASFFFSRAKSVVVAHWPGAGEITTPLDSAHAPRQAGGVFFLASTLAPHRRRPVRGLVFFSPPSDALLPLCGSKGSRNLRGKKNDLQTTRLYHTA